MPLEIRPLLPEDVPGADRAAFDALSPLWPEEHRPADDDERARRGRLRVEHCRTTDPGGAWVAEQDGRIVGVALAIIREDVWGLSLLGVAPGLQGQGVGTRLLRPAVAYGAGCRGGIILSSADPRAMRGYFRSGFDAHPALAAAGAFNASRLPGGLRSRAGDPEADAATIEACSRHVRTASHLPDIGALVASGAELLVCEDRGYAVHRDGSPALVAAVDQDAARDLLWSCFAAGGPGASVHVDFITAGNDWAIDVSLDAGLSLTPDGPVFLRGETGPFHPYLPSGAYL
ncbi:MAG: GNAT family N-acetyltransferase [Solirubrobacterales bacterium]|nr:GNAT family N-acetyltransferase [Solirubrobacterales bacterium]